MDFNGARFTENGLEIERQRLIGRDLQIERYPWEELESVEISDIDELVDESSSGPPYDVRITGAEVLVKSSSNASDEKFEKFQEGLKKETGMEVFYGGGVKFNEELSNNENFEKFISFLFDEDYLSEDDLPIFMPDAKKNFIVNNNKQTDGGGRMDHAGPIETEERTIYYNPKDPLGQKREHIWYLVENYVLNE